MDEGEEQEAVMRLCSVEHVFSLCAQAKLMCCLFSLGYASAPLLLLF